MFKKNVFSVLAVFMIGFGAMIGVIFPFFVVAVTDVPPESVLTALFFTLCIVAGILVGAFNIFLARKIVGAKIRQLSSHMKQIETKLVEKSRTQLLEDCLSDDCYIKVISNDELGEGAMAFNALVKALAQAFDSELEVKRFTEMLSSKLELDELAKEALTSLMDSFKASAGAIIIERESEIVLLSSIGISTPEEIVKSDIVRQVFTRQQRMVINLPEDIKLSGVMLEFRPKSVVVEPIIYKGVVLGCVVLARVEEYELDKHNNMELFGRGLALAFKNAITHDQLQKLAVTDPLTGVLNRRFGLARLKEEYSRAVRADQPLGVIIIDLDYFKKVNDTYGHIVGDKLLIKISSVAKASLREGDVFLRYGGEEFAAILPGASIADAIKIAERIRRYIEETSLLYNGQNIKATVSIGGASYPENDIDDFMGLVERADSNLYKAKENGRNMAVVE